jgi:23S rRNA (cytosine1962-C5)-methyltransferase
MIEPIILNTKPSIAYELLDSGDEEKLERYGKFVLRRPDPQALWSKALKESEWQKADAYFFREAEETGWRKNRPMPEEWQIGLGNIKFNIRPTAFKHTGVFPEQLANWTWTQDLIKKADHPVKVLNLFGYTGGATLAALAAGAEVTHVDSSKASVTWANQNAETSGLKDKPVRWIPEDARKFVSREITRGNKYDGIILDPPAFGRGAQGEVWKIERDLVPLIKQCRQIMTDKPLFFILNGYAAGYSSQAYYNLIFPYFEKLDGKFEIGELMIVESSAKRLLPCGIFARWTSVK